MRFPACALSPLIFFPSLAKKVMYPSLGPTQLDRAHRIVIPHRCQKLTSQLLVRLHAVREELSKLHVLEHQLHILKDPKVLIVSSCGYLSPQSPWRRGHHNALGTWGVHPLPLIQPPPWHIFIALMHTSSIS
ncbi:unnamed protein product [Microthlaspi erraticum]|uniref:Uncharacterized protein n=1 Tax=Microthlaspi erraticum TaxID=1685480 RepID=A0A6D2HNN9_9BRAS|nr:unnamed protein product [Microthlaspi erraticum]